MSFRYSLLKRFSKKLVRKIFPVPKSPWTIGHVDDICRIHLVPPKQLEKFFNNCIVKLQQLKGNDIGDYLEFGVFNGSSIASMYTAAQQQHLTSIRFFGFDAFEGLPTGVEQEDDGVWEKGFYACSFEQMQECLKRKQINPSDITWVTGWYKDTLTNETIQKHNLGDIGIIFVDCDTYSSSKSVLEFIAPLIKQPVIICFDDWKLNDLDIKGMGEYKAFNEFLETNTHLEARSIKSYNRKSRAFIVQPEE